MFDKLEGDLKKFKLGDYWGFELLGIELHEHSAKLSLEISPGDDSRYKWDITCNEVRDYCINNDIITRVILTDKDPLLWDHKENSATLSFSQKPEDPFSLIGRLASKHYELFNSLDSFSLLKQNHFMETISGGFGVLTYGSLPLLEEYSKSLNEYNIKNGIGNVNEKQEIYFNTYNHRPVQKGLKILKFGESFITGRNFNGIVSKST